MSVRVLAASATVDAPSTVAVSTPGPDVFAVVAAAAVLVSVAVMIYLAFVVGSGPGVLEEVGDDSPDESGSRGADDARGTDGDAGAQAEAAPSEADRERDEVRAEST